jgi:hypothetical protein
MPTETEVSLQVKRVCGSKTLKGSKPLRRLLAYLAKSFMERPDGHVKEHEFPELCIEVSR